MATPFDAELISQQIRWAHTYNAYERIAGGDAGPPALAQVLEPCWREWRTTRRIPQWCGVDLLRAWAFYLTRADRHGGGYALAEGGASVEEWTAVMRRLAGHPDAQPTDRPPMNGRTGDGDPVAVVLVPTAAADQEVTAAVDALADWSSWVPLRQAVLQAPNTPGSSTSDSQGSGAAKESAVG